MNGIGPARRDRWPKLIPVGYSGLLAVLIVGPLLGPGYLLLRDAVSTPRSYLADSELGLGDAAPRAVPQDALLAVLSPIIDGGLIVKGILVVALWAAGYGAAVLARELLRVSTGPQLVAVTVALWNPYVAERLLQGHWSLLTGYAALPWTALAAYRIRKRNTPDRTNTRTRSASWAALAACFAAAGLTPTGALLAGCTAVVLIGRRNLLATLALLLAASAPWLTATALSGAGSEPSDPAGIAAFAARAEPALSTLGSLAGLGGIWNVDSVPNSRTTPLALVGTALLLILVATGIRATATADTDRDSVRIRRALLILAAAAVVLPALGATSWGMSVMEWLVAHVPGTGLLRDTQKYVALAMPAYALCAAAGCRTLATWFTAHGAATTSSTEPSAHNSRTTVMSLTAAVFIALLMLPLFDLTWGVGNALRPVHYPVGWQQVAERIDGPGDIAVLPGGMFRKFPYSGRAPVLDPAARMLPRDVLQTGELPVHGRTVAGEGARARDVETLLLHGGSAQQLANLDVGWVLVERTTPGPLGESKTTLAQLEPIYADSQLALYRVPGATDHRAESHISQRVIAYAAHILWAALLVGGLLLALISRVAPDGRAVSSAPPSTR
ncbi:hypothetical protein ACQP1G_44715 [Nocardia sp. CA-107356]|uniref:hypothetical protein n=1 Tax=Nocardia sp. CA-107356 TaxID=3239972 RepID=UPI003D95052D